MTEIVEHGYMLSIVEELLKVSILHEQTIQNVVSRSG